ncbi:uncharacterized protein LOC118242588 [Electrophorus electricus]|uniref:uncharacterized protein LOC118242588 n=1 Tax=Electrophorus electricus TaxID=8005 RepID=UPI0015D05813|nr:uncharacterized protein LOC118242588 [Electrophorus electricus]
MPLVLLCEILPRYVAPRNLPSAGFFPFLQTLMCNTDSTCSNKSYLLHRDFQAYATNRSQRRRREVDNLSSSLLSHLLLQRRGLNHAILKRDTSDQSRTLGLWERMLNSSLEDPTNMNSSIIDVLNSTILADEVTLSIILESMSILKRSFCDFSMSGISISTLSKSEPLASMLVKLCGTDDPAPEVLLSTFHEVMAQLLFLNPSAMIGWFETAVVAMDQLQQQTSLWTFLLDLPDLFLKPTYQEGLADVPKKLVMLKQALTSVKTSFPQANTSVDMLSPFVEESIDLLGFLQTWQGRDVSISLSDVLMPFNMSLVSPEMARHVEQLQIPLSQVLVLINKEDFQNFLCTNNTALDCSTLEVDMIYGSISQEKVILQVFLAWTRSAAPDDMDDSASHPQTLQEQLLLSAGNTVIVMLQGMPVLDHINAFLMKVHSSMQIATAAMEAQIAYIQPMLQKAENLQATMFHTLNQTAADTWVCGTLDSAVQTVIKVLMGDAECPDPAEHLGWMSAYSSMNPELYAALVCPGSSSYLGDGSPLVVKVDQLTSVIEGTLVYNVTPSMILTEWHRLYNTSLQHGASYQRFINEQHHWNFLSEWISYNTPVDWFKILLTRGLKAFGEVGPLLQNSSQWLSLEPHFQMAYWILTYQANGTAQPNCSLASDGIVCQAGFTWENFIPVVESLLMEVSINPAALLRPIAGAEALLQSLYRDTYMDLLQKFLSNSTQRPDTGILEDLTNLLDQNLQVFMNITSIYQLNDQVLLDILNDIMESFGMLRLEEKQSESTQSNDLNAVVMNIIQLLSPDSNLTLNNEGQFAVLDAIFRGLQDLLPPHHHIQLEDLLNHTLALFRNLEACSATAQACLAEVPQVCQALSFLAEVMKGGADVNFTVAPFQNNMTLPLTNLIINLLLLETLNMSWCLDPQPQNTTSPMDYPGSDEADLKLIRNAAMTLLQNQLQVIKVQQMYYDSLGLHENMSIPYDIEAQIMTYLNLTQDWIINPQLTTAIVRILQLCSASGKQQVQLEVLLNRIQAMGRDLALCSPAGWNCLAEVPQVFQTLTLLVEMIKEGADVNITITPLQDNMTLPVTGHILNFVLAWNMSSTIDTVSNVLCLLEKLSATPSVNDTSIQQTLQVCNLTMFELEQFEHLTKAFSLPLLLSDLMEVINNSQCLDHQLQDTSVQGIPGSNETQCVVRLIKGVVGFLQAIPMSNSSQALLSEHLQMVYAQITKLLNSSIPEPKAFGVTEEVLTGMLADIKWSLQNFIVENVTSVTNYIQILEDILYVAFHEQYPYSKINSTLMSQNAYAQLVYNEIALWYLQKLDNTTSGSVFRDHLNPYIRLAEMQILINIAQSNFSTLVSNQIQDLILNVKPPIDETQLNRISKALATILQGQMELLKIEQAYYDSVGFQTNQTISANIETQILNYLNLTKDWITNPQLTLAFAKILHLTNSTVNITTTGMDFEQLMEALASLLPAEDRAYFDVVRQVYQGLNYAMQLSNTDGGLQSDNFTTAVMNSVSLVLENIFNGTNPLTQPVVDDIAGALHISLQLLLNPNVNYSQVQDFIVQVALRVENVISVLAPESAKVVTPMINNIMSYISTISKAGGPGEWNEV